MRERRLPALDLLRGLAALTVAVGHFFIYGNVHVEAIETVPVLAVEVFFVLSGFVLAPQILYCVDVLNSKTLWLFLVRRWMRTIPPYLIALVFISAIFHELGSADFFRYAFYVQNLFGLANQNDYYAIAWSLSVEEWFYLTFPALCMIGAWIALRARRTRARPESTVLWTAIALICACALVRLIAPGAESSALGGIRRVVIYRLDSIAIGVLLYLVARGRNFAASWCLPVFVVVAISAYPLSNMAAVGLGARLAFPVIAAALGITGLLAALSINNALNASLATLSSWLGRISYSLYLFHLVALTIIARMLASQPIEVQFLAYLATCLVFTTLFYELVESPILAARPPLYAGHHRRRVARPAAGKRVLAGVTLSVAVTVFCIVAGEIGFRLIDGYRLGSATLQLRNSHTADDPAAAQSLAKKLTFAADFSTSWFATDPPNYDRSPKFPIPNDWARAVADYKPRPGERAFVADEFKFLYNYNWLVEACRTGEHSNVLEYYKRNPGFVYAFRSPDASTDPPFRIVPRGWARGSDYYNNFGFRGPDITPEKPARTIRIAFLGASTTANGWPYTYPEYVGHFLQLWADANHLNVRFDIVNASRGGINSKMLASVMRYEVAPLHPDIVVYYEGANELRAADFLERPAKAAAAIDVEPSMPSDDMPLESYSALMGRVYELFFRSGGSAAEPPKPPHRLKVDLTAAPSLVDPKLPFDLELQISSLRTMASISHSIGAEFDLTSFITIVHAGLFLDPDRDRFIWKILNGEYWPLTYAEIREGVDFENNAYRELARADGYPFLDVAKYFPQDPVLFADMVHFSSDEGYRLQGWIMAQLLAPDIRAKIASGALPRPAIAADPKDIAWSTATPIKFDLRCLP